MNLRLSIFCFLSTLLTLPVGGQTDPVMQKIIEIGTTDNRSMDHLDVLCNRFGGRLIGSDAYENAAIWHQRSTAWSCAYRT